MIPKISIRSSSFLEKVGDSSGVKNSLFFIFGNKSISFNASFFTFVEWETKALALKLSV